MKTRIRVRDGFTLIELMIVVAIIAIIAAIAIPSYVGIQKRAARSEAKANLEAIALALEGYMAENNVYGRPGNYRYFCGVGCAKSSFGIPPSTTFPAFPLGTIAKLGGGYNYNYWLSLSTALPGPSYTIVASALRGNVAGDISPSMNSAGVKLPTAGFW
jgi:type IV pilus assembly protein PilE